MNEDMGKQRSTRIALALNATIVVLEVGALVSGMAHRGIGALVFYTMLSNLLGGIACSACFACELQGLRRGTTLPRTVRMLKYTAACCLLMTFAVAAFVLAPLYIADGKNGYYLMFCRRELPITHLLAPLLVCVSYALFEADRTITVQQSLVGFLPTAAYLVVAYTCNVVRIWEGPYSFLMVWSMPPWQSITWFLGLCILAFALCQIPRLLGRRLAGASSLRRY